MEQKKTDVKKADTFYRLITQPLALPYLFHLKIQIASGEARLETKEHMINHVRIDMFLKPQISAVLDKRHQVLPHLVASTFELFAALLPPINGPDGFFEAFNVGSKLVHKLPLSKIDIIGHVLI
jgi:hypothetical protein